VTPPGVLRARGDRDFVAEYAFRAPLALALERAMECAQYVGHDLERPVLDVGCGDGTFAEVLFGPDQVDHGLDPDPLELARARARRMYRELHQASGADVPLASGSIGTAMSNSTLEHIRDLDPVLREIHRVLRPGGRLFITVPTDKFAEYSALYRLLSAVGLRREAERFRHGYDAFWRHYNQHSPAEWRALLERSGFTVDKVVEYDPPHRCTIHDLLVPLAFPAYVMKKLIGRYFAFPALRHALVRVARPLLPRSEGTAVRPGTGGLVFLIARRSATPVIPAHGASARS
jgi:SAM-dependent methyltransferase